MTHLIPVKRNIRNRKSDLGFGNLPTFSNWIDEVFNETFNSDFFNRFENGSNIPAVNIRENENETVMEFAVPGFEKGDFNIDFEDDVLTISAERKSESETKENEYTRKEFGYASFKRSFTLPETINSDAIKAAYVNGILELTLPVREEAKKKPVRKIEIS